MTRSTSGTSTGERRCTRRQLLGSGVAVAGGIALAGGGFVSAQVDDTTTDAVIVEQDQYEQDLLGFWLHIQGEVTPNQAAAVDDDCEVVDWPDDETVGYDAKLIDRTADPQSATITLYLHERVEITTGDLFIINSHEQCQSAYLGVQIERISSNPGVSADPTAADGGGAVADETTTSGNGTGFGVLGALTGVLGVGWLLDRRRED